MSSKDVNSVGLQWFGPRRAATLLAGLIWTLALGACEQPPPRTFDYFMEDRIAREGTLFRCNQDPDGGTGDIECAQAKRAAAVIALRAERQRSESLERESEAKLAQLRKKIAERARRAREAAILAAAAEEAAYEALWSPELDGEAELAPIEVPVSRMDTAGGSDGDAAPRLLPPR